MSHPSETCASPPWPSAHALAPSLPAAVADSGHQRWSVEAVQQLLDLPFMELLYRAQTVHRQHWPDGEIELATLLSVKTGGCPKTAATARRRPSSTPA